MTTEFEYKIVRTTIHGLEMWLLYIDGKEIARGYSEAFAKSCLKAYINGKRPKTDHST